MRGRPRWFVSVPVIRTESDFLIQGRCFGGGDTRLRDFKRKTVSSADLPKASNGSGNSLFGTPKPVLEAFKMRYKFTVLNAHYRFQI